MPNQRAAGLRVVGVYITEKEHDQLKFLADKAGMNKAVYVRHLIKRMMDEATAEHTKKPETKTNNKTKTEQ